jgi:hypothetical protein
MDEEARSQPMKATKQQKPEVYRLWERDDVLSEIQKLIERKKAKDYKGSAYQRFILPIYTDEPNSVTLQCASSWRARHFAPASLPMWLFACRTIPEPILPFA